MQITNNEDGSITIQTDNCKIIIRDHEVSEIEDNIHHYDIMLNDNGGLILNGWDLDKTLKH
jgi:hypothetical protein